MSYVYTYDPETGALTSEIWGSGADVSGLDHAVVSEDKLDPAAVKVVDGLIVARDLLLGDGA